MTSGQGRHISSDMWLECGFSFASEQWRDCQHALAAYPQSEWLGGEGLHSGCCKCDSEKVVMAKHTKPKPEKGPTKKQIAISRRQREYNRKLLIGLGVVAVLVLAVAAVGVYDILIARPARPVAIVNGVSIRADQYRKRVLFERHELDRILQNIQSQLAVTDPNDPNNEFLIQYYQQIGDQFYQQRMGIDRQVLDNMVEEELGRQKAAEVGLTTSDEEISEAIRARMASRLGYVTQAQATSIAGTVVAATATAQIFTPTPMPTSTPTLAVPVTITDTLATEAEESPTPAPTATRHIVTDDEFSQEYAAYLENLTDEAEVREADYWAFVEARLVVESVSDYFAEQVPTEAEQVNMSHIRAETEGNAAGVLRRLDDGEDFSLVATQASSDTFTAQKGGELGWFAEGELTARFNQDVEDAAFSLAPGSYSRPISTTLGLQIVLVNERGLQPLNDRQLRTLQQVAYSDWLTEARSSEGVEILWEPEMAPSDPFLEEALGSPGGPAPIQQ